MYRNNTYTGTLIDGLIAAVERVERGARDEFLPAELREMPVAYLAQFSYGEELVVA